MRWILLCLPLILSAAACQSPLVVASDLDNLPFAGVDAEGTPIGRDVEMMESLGREIEWRRMPFEELLGAVEAGEVDVVCATLGFTPERAERVGFTGPYYTTTISAVVRNEPNRPERLGHLAGKRVGAGAGTTSQLAVRNLLPHAVVEVGAKSTLGSLERLLSREVDCLVMDGPAARALVASSDGRLAVMDQALDVEAYCLAVRPDDPDLAQELSQALEALETSGALAELDEKHGLEIE